MSGDGPRVSILIPARDAADTISACLSSVRRQRETRFECVVVDDGSRDDTRAIAEAFARRDARFRVVVQPALGLVPALGRGLEACQGRYVARMDADDWMHAERLGLQADSLDADPRLSGVGCHVRLFPRRHLRDGLRDYERWLRAVRSASDVRRDRFVECPLPHPSWMLRRETFRAFGYRDRGWPEDYDLLLRLLAAGHEIGVVPRRLLGWRDGPARMWRTNAAYTPAAFLECKAHHLAQGPLRHTDRYLLWGFGETGKALRRALAERGKHVAGIVELHPRRLGERIHGARVVRPERLPSLPRLPILTAVAGAFARAEIRGQLGRLGYREGVDFTCTA